jgi:hypothetical protein
VPRRAQLLFVTLLRVMALVDACMRLCYYLAAIVMMEVSNLEVPWSYA